MPEVSGSWTGGRQQLCMHCAFLHSSLQAMPCRDLAHLYHYYLHGEQGNRQPGSNGSQAAAAHSSSQGQAQGGPTITLQCITDGRLQWDRNLAQVEDDLESCYLKVGAQPMSALFHFQEG